METEAMPIGIVMQRYAIDNRWQPFQWRPLEIIDGLNLQSAAPHCMRSDADDVHWLFGGLEVKLFSDEGEGYFLNISAPVPCWFIMWRIEDVEGTELAVPKFVTLSYNEAARLMDGGECVDTLPLSAAIIERLTAFTQHHYHPEPKKKRKKPSFEGGAGVDQMARQEGGNRGG